jgi:hypothetical protein
MRPRLGSARKANTLAIVGGLIELGGLEIVLPEYMHSIIVRALHDYLVSNLQDQ